MCEYTAKELQEKGTNPRLVSGLAVTIFSFASLA